MILPAVQETRLIPGLGRSAGEGVDYPPQYSGLENSTDYTVHGVTKRWTCLFTTFLALSILLFLSGSDGKESACCAGDLGSIPGPERSPRDNGSPFKYSCLESPMDGGAWWGTIHGIAKSQPRLSD